MGKRGRDDEDGFVFNLVSCIGGIGGIGAIDAMAEAYDAPVVTVAPVVDFCVAMDLQPLAPSFTVPLTAPVVDAGSPPEFEPEDIDGEPFIEDLGVTYNPVDEDRCNSSATERMCGTPNPTYMLDEGTLVVLNLLAEGADDGALEGMQPLRPEPMRAQPPLLNQNGTVNCFATHPVGNPPLLGPSVFTADEYAGAAGLVPEHKAPKDQAYWHRCFRSVEGNHSGLFSEEGGLNAWMASRKPTMMTTA